MGRLGQFRLETQTTISFDATIPAMKTFLWYWRLVCRWLVEAYFDNATGLAAMMAYDLIFIVVAPGLFLLSEALSLFGTNPSLLHQIIELIKGFLPEISRDVIQQQVVTLVMSGSTSYVALLGVPLALYLGINLINTVSRTLNHCLGIPEPKRSWWNRWIIALVLLFWFGITLLFSVSAIVFGERLAGVIQHTYHLGFDLTAIVAFWKYPVIIVALMVLALSLYLLTPEVYQTVRQALPGSVFFSLSWLVSTAIFGFYVKERGSRYQETYQTYANLIVLLTWTWLTCLLLLLGGRLNAILVRKWPTRPWAAPAEQDPFTAEAGEPTGQTSTIAPTVG